jgi:MarR family transcriptional regulator, organic hydroperoxide resistance regulator
MLRMRTKIKPTPADPGEVVAAATTGESSARRVRLFHLLAQAKQNLFRSANDLFLSAIGHSGTQVVALFVIQEQEGCQLKDLGRQLQLKSPAVTGLVSRMAESGLIQRTPCSVDGRASRLHLTREGKAVLAKAAPVFATLNAQLTEGFTADEIAIVARFLRHGTCVTFHQEKAP